jgi:hypothetical protein
MHKAIDNIGDSAFLRVVHATFKEYNVRYFSDYELSDEEKTQLDGQKKLHKAGK